ncbi:MAG: T9SS type B sorting domain-containing protein [Bacteroidota bacterium]
MTAVFAQREAANWYFGNFAGLDFNSGAPEFLLDGQINTVEGCESFSDAQGNLLFYTEGKTVWNRRHEVMPNGTGLGGSFSTTQSALVVPHPVSKNLYFIFTPDDALSISLGGSNGFNYSVLDMSRDGGLGDIVTKNVTLLDECSEKVSAVRNQTGDYYWVITHYRNRFYAYRVDNLGVNTTPVVSTVGPLIDDFENIRGSLKMSPNGDKLAIAHTIVRPENKGSLYLFDFDVNTGVVSNPLLVSDKRLYYGVEFSSNSSKLYASGLTISGNSADIPENILELVQFDLDDPDIPGSAYVVNTFGANIIGDVAGSLQIGIDKKVYHAIPNAKLSVIRTPNLKGIDCDFREFGVDLGNRASSYGLPPFIQSFFETIVTIENFCEGDVTTFTTESSGDVAAIHWDFGDPASGANNFSTDLNPTHVFSSNGLFEVTVEVEYTNGSNRTFLEFVEIAEIPDVNSVVQLVQCDVDGMDDGISKFNLNEAISLFSKGNEDINGLFFTTEQDAIANVNQLEPVGYTNSANNQRLYVRAFENAECFVIVQVELIVKPMSDLGLYGTIAVCDEGFSALASTISLSNVYHYLEGEFLSSKSIKVFSELDNALLELGPFAIDEELILGPFDSRTLFFRIEEENACDQMGSIQLNILERPDYETERAVQLCDNGEAFLMSELGYDTYTWSNGSASDAITVIEPGEYSVTFTQGVCSYTQVFTVEPVAGIKISEIDIRDFRPNNSVVVHVEAGGGEIQYSIDGGVTFQPSNSFQELFPGTYEIVVTDNCSEVSETILVGGLSTFFTPNGDGINDIWTLSNATYFPNFKLSIFDKYGKLINRFTDALVGWDGTYQNQPMPSDDYWYLFESEEGKVATGHFSLKR